MSTMFLTIKRGIIGLREWRAFCRKPAEKAISSPVGGGDEFAAILLNTDKKEAALIAERIMWACKSNQETDIPFSISLGLATKSDKGADLFNMLKEAERAMYEMKLLEGKKAKATIVETIEARLHQKGYETKEHIERLQNLAREFAAALGMSQENTADLLMAVKYHDIGIIGIPDEDVVREFYLDESQWTNYKKHVEIGYRIAGALGELAHLANIILHHHEWWNGQGHPQELKGNEIPLMSRIISILHAFDTMTNRQLAEHSMTTQAALEALQKQAGVRFDPNLVLLFTRMMTEKTTSAAVS